MTMTTPKKLKNQKGFSLVEILIAVTIIVLMGGVVAFNLFPELFRSQRDKAALDINTLKEAVQLFQLRESRLPHEGEWQAFLFDGSKKHRDPYIDTSAHENREVLDPWGNPYQYRRLNSREFEIFSWGMDGAPGGEGDDADISSRKERG
jgi:general secretion pathway protein G